MPLPVSKFKQLADKKSGRVIQRHPGIIYLNLSKQCGYYPNWRTNKRGECKRTGCKHRGDELCPVRE